MFGSVRNRPHVPAGLAIVGLGLLWGAGFPAIDVVVAYLPPLGAAGIRYAVSGCIVLTYAAVRVERVMPRTWREWFSIAVVGGFMFGGYQAGLYMGTQYISGAVASVITTMSPVVAALVAVPLLGESRGLLDVAGFILGAAGVVVISQPSLGAGSVSATSIGVGLVFLGTMLFAIGSVTIQLFDNDLAAEALQGWAMLTGAGLLFCGSVARGETIPPIESLSIAAVGALVYITLIAGAGGYLLYFRLVRRVGATETTLVAYLEPISATIISVSLFEQPIDTATVIGFFAVVIGFSLVSRSTLQETIAQFRDSTARVRPISQKRGD